MRSVGRRYGRSAVLGTQSGLRWSLTRATVNSRSRACFPQLPVDDDTTADREIRIIIEERPRRLGASVLDEKTRLGSIRQVTPCRIPWFFDLGSGVPGITTPLMASPVIERHRAVQSCAEARQERFAKCSPGIICQVRGAL